MNLKMFHEQVSAGMNPGLLKYLYRIEDEPTLKKKYNLLKKMPEVPVKLREAFHTAVKAEIDQWKMELSGVPETMAEVSGKSDGRIELLPENFKKYYDELLKEEGNPVLKVAVKDIKKESFTDFEICSREQDISRRSNAGILTRTEVVDYDLIALSSYMRISTDTGIDLPKAIALGTISGAVINYIAGFIDKSMEKEFVEFF
ncbi:MAG: hypothetical protein WC279_13585 [Sulfurimonas sp.]|jgi:hypothetical protein|uniref:hypothetical protein n=1 Tax=Sulfurimonas sp. TaxID=2022749 RepID=UPI0035668052